MLNTLFSPWPSFSQEEMEAVSDVLKSGKVNYWTGTQCREFEKEFAAWGGVSHAVSLANGTVALDAALFALDIGVGDEVIVTSRTFLASVSSIVLSGATPVFADVSADSQNITPETIQACITPKTKAIMCVHLAGWPCDMDAIMALAETYKLYVIEDCAQAHGALYKGRSVGSIGHIGAWSFCQDKIMTTGGEGGMVTTNNEQYWQKMWSYKDHGKSWDAVYNQKHAPGFRWLHHSFGTNWRMTEMQAAIGRIQLQKMPTWQKTRLAYANKIWKTAEQFKALRVPKIPEGITHAAYKCYVFVDTHYLNADWNRDKIIEALNALQIPCLAGSCSEVYLEKAFDNTTFKPKERLPVAKILGETSVMFLVHPTLSEQAIECVCEALVTVMTKASKGI